jgi:activator of HSP90 ATPase
LEKMMNDNVKSEPFLYAPTRRQLLAGVTVTLGSLATASAISANRRQQDRKETPATVANQTRTALHQEIEFKATPRRIYGVLLDSKQFAAFTGLAAEIDPGAGGVFQTFGGLIVGRNVELVPNERIVQAWRPTHWDPGVYSIVRFELKPQGSSSIVILDHTGFPEGEYDHLNEGWPLRYWEPLKKFLAS